MARRRKPTSCRPLKLTEAQAIALRNWYYNDRTIAQKARELGISKTTAYAYINRLHKPRKPSVEDVSGQLGSVPQITEGGMDVSTQSAR